MAGAGGEETQRTFRLKITSPKELELFMREILPAFLRVVDPRQSGLLDILYANEVITESDNSSLSGKDVMTRKDQARKLFILLNKVPLKVFMSKVAPELCAKFPHIIPEKFQGEISEDLTGGADDCSPCFRHVIQHRVRLASMVDDLYHQGLLDLEEYTVITDRARKKEDVWESIFEKCLGQSQAGLRKLEQVVRKHLEKYWMPVPGNLQEMVSLGFPCMCPEPAAKPPESSVALIRKVTTWLEGRKMSPVELPDPIHNAPTPHFTLLSPIINEFRWAHGKQDAPSLESITGVNTLLDLVFGSGTPTSETPMSSSGLDMESSSFSSDITLTPRNSQLLPMLPSLPLPKTVLGRKRALWDDSSSDSSDD